MRQPLLLAAALVAGTALGYLLASGRPAHGRGPAHPPPGRMGEVRVSHPSSAAYPGRVYHRLTVYRKHGEPVQPCPEAVTDVWTITVRDENGGEEIYFARPVDE